MIRSLIHNFLDGSILIVEQALHLEGAQVSDVVRRHAVVIEQEPFALVLHDAMVCCPAYNGIEDDALVGEGTIRIVADGVAEHVAVTGGVAEVILAVILVHP